MAPVSTKDLKRCFSILITHEFMLPTRFTVKGLVADFLLFLLAAASFGKEPFSFPALYFSTGHNSCVCDPSYRNANILYQTWDIAYR